MTDFIDQMNDREEAINEAQLKAVREKARIAPGYPGDCELCGEPSGRLINGNCAPCRDKWRLP